MEIQCVPLGVLSANCYLLSSERAALVIDPGKNSDTVTRFLTENAGKDRLILLTHAHFDHIGGALALREATGVPIAIGEPDGDALADPEKSLSDSFHARLRPFHADRLLADGETVTVGDLTATVHLAPGHTPGGACYRFGNDLFSGDVLFFENIGRVDFPGGDADRMKRSLRGLLTEFPEETVVWPGHGEKTTIAHEQRCNPYRNWL